MDYARCSTRSKTLWRMGWPAEVEHDQWVRTARVPDSDRSLYEDEVIFFVPPDLGDG